MRHGISTGIRITTYSLVWRNTGHLSFSKAVCKCLKKPNQSKNFHRIYKGFGSHVSSCLLVCVCWSAVKYKACSWCSSFACNDAHKRFKLHKQLRALFTHQHFICYYWMVYLRYAFMLSFIFYFSLLAETEKQPTTLIKCSHWCSQSLVNQHEDVFNRDTEALL